jgi:hypothetical protein
MNTSNPHASATEVHDRKSKSNPAHRPSAATLPLGAVGGSPRHSPHTARAITRPRHVIAVQINRLFRRHAVATRSSARRGPNPARANPPRKQILPSHKPPTKHAQAAPPRPCHFATLPPPRAHKPAQIPPSSERPNTRWPLAATRVSWEGSRGDLIVKAAPCSSREWQTRAAQRTQCVPIRSCCEILLQSQEGFTTLPRTTSQR